MKIDLNKKYKTASGCKVVALFAYMNNADTKFPVIAHIEVYGVVDAITVTAEGKYFADGKKSSFDLVEVKNG